MSLVSIYRASIFYCMAIAAEMSLPTGPPLAADGSAVGLPAASKTSVTTAAVVAAAAANAAAINAADAAVAFEGRVGSTMSPLARVLS